MATREHKYRAWDTVKKVMYSAEELGQDQETLSVDGMGFVNVSGDSTRLSQFHVHLLPLEFTGLKDKNGKEIYEGDIVEFPLEYGGLVRQVVLFRRGAFITESGRLWGFDKETDYLGFYEIIGNIYENPELIKKGGE